MGQAYLIDTNVVCDYIASSFSNTVMSFLDTIIDAGPNLSLITQIELLSWSAIPQIEALTSALLHDSSVFGISDDVIKYCVAIRRARKLKIPDAIIAATALANDLTLLTRNVADFKKVDGLNVINPWVL